VKQVKVHTAIACEYVALGSHGKHTLINIYSGDDIHVQQFPALIPISCYVEIIPDRDLPTIIQVEIFNNGKLQQKLAAMVDAHDLRPGRRGVLVIPQMAWVITHDTELKVVMSGEGIRTTTALKKMIKVGEIPPG
jgi:hypothetical protein